MLIGNCHQTTGDSVERLPPPGTLNIERVYKELC